jgi:hypothetical protein
MCYISGELIPRICKLLCNLLATMFSNVASAVYREFSMATLGRLSGRILQFKVKSPSARQCFVTFRDPKSVRAISAACMCMAGGGLLFYVAHRLGKLNTVHAFKSKKVKL